ncbi:hypothetical protein CHH28_17325 [Bacterioplanes sanyensis]|uniref:Uncharacterized protein n=1 Tax=Bacterioplanes sanyensis TaxID=1249553 RepID=A0A222FNJ6_9GAMM|nr:hypothetical protein [Bacterioplanes sanyensis]ASP40329.1 hypothetical protein CHH28_17325 [Bacterioplanes sanyensis]
MTKTIRATLNNYTSYPWTYVTSHLPPTSELLVTSPDTAATPRPFAEQIAPSDSLTVEFELFGKQTKPVTGFVHYSICNALNPKTILALDFSINPQQLTADFRIGFLFRSDPRHQFLGSSRIDIIEPSDQTPMRTYHLAVYGQTVERPLVRPDKPWVAPGMG